MAPLARGLAEPLPTSDWQREDLRIGLRAESVETRLHGRYFEAARNGLVFAATQTAGVTINNQAGTSASFALANPPGSGRIVSLIRWDVVVTTLPVTPVVGVYGLYANTSTRAAAVTGTTVVEVPAIVGTNNLAVANVFSSATLPANPTLYRVFENKLTGIASKFPAVFRFFLDFEDTCQLAPGTSLALQQLAADATNAAAICSVVWEEMPQTDYTDQAWEMGG